ncbi:hypothetical protein JTB14_003779 [Gonioctena quinquepunctata]|nr:hypothetical protein JTB14_003779 [Gonioctena quinquepunctata]
MFVSMNFLVCVLIFLHVGLADDATLNKKKFPEKFLFGAATAAYQIEGAWNLDGKSQNIWDNVTHKKPSFVSDLTNADVACDSYHKYKEDVAMLKAIGVDYYRFSVAWTRILPTGFPDEINDLGVEYYKNLIKELKDNHIMPIITLYHGDLPQSLQDLGGIQNPLFPKWFSDYARVCFRLFGDDVKYWLTYNEPHVTCTTGYVSLLLRDGIDSYICAQRILTGHAAVWHVYDEEFRDKQKGKVAIVLNSDWMEPGSNSTEDLTAAEQKLQFTWGWYAHPLYHGDWPEIMKTRIAMRSKLEGFNQSRLPELTQEQIDFIKGTNDYFAVNTYTTTIVEAIPEPEITSTPSFYKDQGVRSYQREDWEASPLAWLKIVPWGIRKLLKWLKDEYNNPEILITENGYADATGQLDDDIRLNYFKDYLSNIRDAMEKDGVNLIGYTAWSLIDNFEWTSGYT